MESTTLKFSILGHLIPAYRNWMTRLNKHLIRKRSIVVTVDKGDVVSSASIEKAQKCYHIIPLMDMYRRCETPGRNF